MIYMGIKKACRRLIIHRNAIVGRYSERPYEMSLSDATYDPSKYNPTKAWGIIAM